MGGLIPGAGHPRTASLKAQPAQTQHEQVFPMHAKGTTSPNKHTHACTGTHSVDSQRVFKNN